MGLSSSQALSGTVHSWCWNFTAQSKILNTPVFIFKSKQTLLYIWDQKTKNINETLTCSIPESLWKPVCSPNPRNVEDNSLGKQPTFTLTKKWQEIAPQKGCYSWHTRTTAGWSQCKRRSATNLNSESSQSPISALVKVCAQRSLLQPCKTQIRKKGMGGSRGWWEGRKEGGRETESTSPPRWLRAALQIRPPHLELREARSSSSHACSRLHKSYNWGHGALTRNSLMRVWQ